MENVIHLDTSLEVFELNTAAVPPAFWPTVTRPVIRRDRQEAYREALVRTMAWANNSKEL